MKKVIGVFILITGVWLVSSTQALSASLLLNSNNQLIGAGNVEVNNDFYDVLFLEGSALNIFGPGGLHADSIQWVNGMDASQALLDQVLIDVAEGQFDTDPSLTFGIEDPGGGLIYSVNYYTDTGVSVSFAGNMSPALVDHNGGIFSPIPITYDTGDSPNHVFAAWYAAANNVPIPSTFGLLATGILWIAGLIRKRNQF